MISALPVFVAVAGAALASAHVAFWHESMYGFNVTQQTFPYDNRPVVPLYGMTFDQWWFHGHINYPPKDGKFFELPAGGTVNTQLSCDKGATSFFASSPGGDAGFGVDFACPGAQPSAIHATGINDVTGSALAITYKSDVHAVQPEDFVIFSTNKTSPWFLNTAFDVPQLPACPPEGCHCAWFWIHSVDSGSQQIYMNGFKCKVTGNVGDKPLGKPMVPRRCGGTVPDPGNCTIGAKSPMYWFQKERNNMFEDQYTPPYYNELYGFENGALNDIFQDGVIASLAGSSTNAPASASTHVSAPSSSPSSAAVTTSAAAQPATTSSTAAQPPAISSTAAQPPAATSIAGNPPAATSVAGNPPATTSVATQAVPTTLVAVAPPANTHVDVPSAIVSVPVDVPASLASVPAQPTATHADTEAVSSTSTASSSASTGQCKRKRTINAKRHNSRQLSSFHH